LFEEGAGLRKVDVEFFADRAQQTAPDSFLGH
jgi:hypothetical protein